MHKHNLKIAILFSLNTQKPQKRARVKKILFPARALLRQFFSQRTYRWKKFSTHVGQRRKKKCLHFFFSTQTNARFSLLNEREIYFFFDRNMNVCDANKEKKTFKGAAQKMLINARVLPRYRFFFTNDEKKNAWNTHLTREKK